MHGDPKVIEELNTVLSSELTAIVQYVAQSEMRQGWGYKWLGDLVKARSIEEMRQAEREIERIIFLNATRRVEVGLNPQVASRVGSPQWAH